MKKAAKNKVLKWVKAHFKPEEAFVLGDFWYGIFYQGNDQYAIKKIRISHCEFSLDEGDWVSWPEKRYETLSGACRAILLNHEKDSK